MSLQFQRRIVFVLFLFFPAHAFASVSITEVLYDVAGSDSGHEWIEIQNTGADTLDLTGWKFFEEGVNHKLVPLGNAIVPAGAFAVIVDDAAVFRADWPGFLGVLFDSSFSLKNTGESLALKNASSTVLVGVSYDATKGAGGDGNSLNFIGDSFVPRRPTPGNSAAPESIVPPQKAPIAVRNLPPKEAVGNADAIEESGEDAKAVLAVSVVPLQMDPLHEESDGASSFLPWVAGLIAVVGVGITAVFMLRPKKRESEYTIIEDKS